MLAVAVQKYSPAVNPDRVFLKITPSGDYTQETGDTLNLNPGTWSDPGGVGVLGYPTNPPEVDPSIFSENLGGYYAQVVPGATLATYAIRFFESEGTELPAEAYPDAIADGNLTVEVLF